MHYFYILVIHEIEDHILPAGKAAYAAAQIITGATHSRILIEHVETLDDCINDIVGVACVPLSLKVVLNVAEVRHAPVVPADAPSFRYLPD
jgi:hypothetical protein